MFLCRSDCSVPQSENLTQSAKKPVETFGKVEALFKNKSSVCLDFSDQIWGTSHLKPQRFSCPVMLFEASEGKTKVAGPSEVTPAEAETLPSRHERRFRLLSFWDCIRSCWAAYRSCQTPRRQPTLLQFEPAVSVKEIWRKFLEAGGCK